MTNPLETARSETEGADILYRKKFRDVNSKTWSSVGTFRSAVFEVAFFKPVINSEANECALGDIAVQGNDFPDFGHLIVTALKKDALSHPAQFNKIFVSQGAKNQQNVEIYEMKPISDDYRCIGHVARDVGDTPSLKDYCCVKRRFHKQDLRIFLKRCGPLLFGDHRPLNQFCMKPYG